MGFLGFRALGFAGLGFRGSAEGGVGKREVLYLRAHHKPYTSPSYVSKPCWIRGHLRFRPFSQMPTKKSQMPAKFVGICAILVGFAVSLWVVVLRAGVNLNRFRVSGFGPKP